MIDESGLAPSVAHRGDWQAARFQLGGDVPWQAAVAPDIAAGRDTGRMRACAYCGSMHPADVAAAIRAGARGSWADRKYGWPHKAYFEGVPNPHAGQLEVRGWRSDRPRSDDPRASDWVEMPDLSAPKFDAHTGEPLPPKTRWVMAPAPAAATTYAKFYTVHLQDAKPEDREVIERHLRVRFTFKDDGGLKWAAIQGAA